MKKNGPSEEALKAFYEAILPAAIRIAKEEKKKTTKVS
jgi:histone H3/H4